MGRRIGAWFFIAVWTGAVGCLSLGNVIGAEEEGLTLTRAEPYRTAFADREVAVKATIGSVAPWKGRIVWGLINADKITLVRGEVAAECDADKKVEVAIPLKWPSVKAGAILPTRLTLALVTDGAKEPALVQDSPLWIYSVDPFHERRKWLEDLRVGIYDPIGATAERLNQDKLSFEKIETLAGLADYGARVLMVGEGVSFREERGLAEELVAAAERGVAVICLAPSGGDLPVPSRDGRQAAPTGLLLQQNESISRLDKRLDAVQWGRVPAKPLYSLQLLREGSQVVADVSPGDEGWSWLEMRFPPPDQKAASGRCVVCCFPLIKHWDESPTPRFLLARLLEYVTVQPSVFEPVRDSGAP